MRHARQTNRRDQSNVLKGVAAGVIGGLVASFVMEEFQTLWSKISTRLEQTHDEAEPDQSGQQAGRDAEQEPATVQAAEAISAQVFGHKLQEREQGPAGEAVHYAMGATSGACYGALAELAPVVTIGAGLPFGAAVWLVADDVVVPALGLAKSPRTYPLSTHAYALASHFVYGLTTDIVRRAIRSML